ncbi:MAG: right-handed parallel beta-helix repeat-containing protein [Rubripirellula sp.]
MRRLRFPFLIIVAASISVAAYSVFARIRPGDDGAYHVHEGQSIQAVLDVAAANPDVKRVLVHEGVYRPEETRQALIWLNAKHNGIVLEAVGEVVLTAKNPRVGSESEEGFPAAVNHVVYFGDGIGPETTLRGFKITGANNFVTLVDHPEPIQPPTFARGMEKELFFYCDGGGIKIYGRSYPTIENVEIFDCYSSPCGAGVSIEHRGDYAHQNVKLINCIFRGNRVPATGSAVDLLWGSRAEITNCLFLENLSNEPMDQRALSMGYWKPENGAGALTILPDSKAIVRRCTFVGNRNGVDDSSSGSIYQDSIFWKNNATGGWPTGSRYELDVTETTIVQGCMINGDAADLQGHVDPENNVLDCPDPKFDDRFRPTSDGFDKVGYRPAS